MPIQRRQLWGALAQGLGAGLEGYGEIQARREAEQRRQDFELKKMQLGEIEKLQNNLSSHPDQVQFFLQAAKANPLLSRLDLSPYQGAAKTMGLQQLGHSLNTAASPDAIPADIGAEASMRTGSPMPSVPLSNASDFGAQADYQDAPPELNTLLNLASGRKGQLTQAREDKVGEIGRTKFAEAQGAKAGSLSAENANFPTHLQQVADELYTKGPIEADNAGQKTGAEKRAALAPDIVQGEGRAAGVKASAEKRAQLAAEYDPKMIAGAATRAGEIAKAEAVAKGDTQRLKFIESAKENGVMLGAQLSRLVNLYDAAKGGDLKAASLYSDLSKNLQPVIARASGYNGRMTITEMNIAGGAIPGLKDAILGTADKKFAYIKGLAVYGPKVAAMLPPDASIEEYLDTVKRLVDAEPPPSGTVRGESSPVPPAVQGALRTAPPGRHTLSDGSVWEKAPSGTVTKVP